MAPPVVPRLPTSQTKRNTNTKLVKEKRPPGGTMPAALHKNAPDGVLPSGQSDNGIENHRNGGGDTDNHSVSKNAPDGVASSGQSANGIQHHRNGKGGNHRTGEKQSNPAASANNDVSAYGDVMRPAMVQASAEETTIGPRVLQVEKPSTAPVCKGRKETEPKPDLALRCWDFVGKRNHAIAVSIFNLLKSVIFIDTNDDSFYSLVTMLKMCSTPLYILLPEKSSEENEAIFTAFFDDVDESAVMVAVGGAMKGLDTYPHCDLNFTTLYINKCIRRLTEGLANQKISVRFELLSGSPKYEVELQKLAWKFQFKMPGPSFYKNLEGDQLAQRNAHYFDFGEAEGVGETSQVSRLYKCFEKIDHYSQEIKRIVGTGSMEKDENADVKGGVVAGADI